MYEKFETNRKDFISERLYFNDTYRILKTIITTYLFHPYLKKLLMFECHIGFLITEEEFEKQLNDKESIYNIAPELFLPIKEDLALELQKYCPNPSKNKTYFFQKAFHKNKELPEYYSTLNYTLFKCRDTISINKQNYRKYQESVKDFVIELIENLIVNPKALSYFNDFNVSMNNFLMRYKRFGEKSYQHILRANESLKHFEEDKVVYYWAKNVIYSLCYEVYPDIALICEHCGQIMKYAKNKKFCSLKKDGKDCGKSAANKRNYLKKKLN